MSSALMMFLLFFICGFGAMYVCFAPQARKYVQTLELKFYMLPVIYVWLFFALGSIGAYWVLNNNDFIEPLTLWRVLLPLGLAVIIYGVSLVEGGIIFGLAVCGAVAVLVWAQPVGQGSPFPDLPVWSIRFGTIILGSIFCLYYNMMNSTTQAFVIPLLAILFGIGVLGALGAAPMFCAIAGAVLMGTLTAYLGINYFGPKIDLDSGACTVIAFLIFSLLMLNFGEFGFVPCATFTMIFWVELASALWHKYMVTHAGSLMENSNYYLAATKYSHNVLALNIFKICGICVFLGWFQLFAANTFSLPLLAFLIILWLNNSFGKSDIGEPKNLKEINRAFVADLKQNIEDAKEALNIQKKDK